MSSGAESIVHGVDVGATKIAAAAVAGGEPREAVERPTDRSGPDALVAGLESVLRELAARTGRPDAIGVGVPSQVEFATGRVLASVNIPLAGVELRTELERRLGVPAFVDNDGNCAALAEASGLGSGGGPPAGTLVMLTLGTGVGGGIVAGGAPFRGATGLGAELGHLVVDADGPECPGSCPNRGCLEALCSGQALERDATALAERDPGSPLAAALAAHGRVTGHEVVAAARAGDSGAIAIFDRLARFLGAGMSGLVNAFEPERLVIGGGLSRAADLFLDTARREALARALPAAAATTSIELARGGPAAGVVGAALLAAHEHVGTGGHT